MRGRKPKPTVLHKLQGTFNASAHRDRKSEPKPEGELLTPPRDMTAAQKKILKRVVEVAPKGVLFQIDETVLRAWVETVDRRAELQRVLDADRGAVDWELNAAHRGIDRATLLLVRLTEQLGFSPASRPRIKAETPRDPDPDSSWALLRLPLAGDGGKPSEAH
jgi:hypothetical protein